MKIKPKKTNTFLFFLLFIISKNWTQNFNIDYYGVVSTQIDSNMAKMTGDLYFAQLSEINNFSVSDKRSGNLLSQIPDSSSFSENALSFFTVIEKNEVAKDDSWITVFHVVDSQKGEEYTKQKKYASFYKILMESKNELKETIRQLIEKKEGTPISQNQTDSKTSQSASKLQDKNTFDLTTKNQSDLKQSALISAENLSGTWKGENNIDKIVILRGGRGFVIFKNGASMSITVKILENNSNQIIVTQSSKSNASFFPELPRNIALSAAPSAEPIQWMLSLSENDTLMGTKTTLIPDGDSYKKGEITVEWTKSN